jgi:Ca2+-transporting ATPase
LELAVAPLCEETSYQFFEKFAEVMEAGTSADHPRHGIPPPSNRGFSDFTFDGHGVFRLRVTTLAICACRRFSQKKGARVQPFEPVPDGFGIAPAALTRLLQDRQLEVLDAWGGIDQLCSKVNTNKEYGLDETEEQMQKRREAFGSNTYPKKVTKGFWSFVWDACKDTTLNILMVCAIVSLGTGIWTEGIKKGWYEGTSIGVAVLLVIVVTATSDYKQGLNFRNLNDEKENIQLEVLRAGKRQMVSIFDLVVGDIVPLSIGGQVPADGVLVEGHSLSIDESTMTGESFPVKKDKTRPFLLSGCKVQDGQGTMLVTGVGLNTEWGQVMASISQDNGEQTPLQVRLNGAATLIGKVGLAVASVVLVILIIRYFAIAFKNATAQNRRAMQVIKDMVNIFSIAVTIVVVAVPEGLPLAVTLTLAYSMRKMMADKSLVRQLAACETMGSATTICSDKTGTLTTNKMTVTRVCLAAQTKDVDESLADVERLPEDSQTSLVNSVCLNSNGNVSPPKEGEEPAVTGSPTEAAILTWGLKLGMNFHAIRHENEVLHVETFNSEKKRAGVVYKNRNGMVELHWKGAAEIILDLCDSWMDATGECQPMTDEKRQEFNDVIEGMAAQALRCIAFAYRPFDETEIPDSEDSRSDWKAPDDGLVLMAVVGIKDPCRPGVREAVAQCQRAGVKVRMVTGDNIYTAKAIAAECGILTEPGQLVVEGKDFRTWDDAKLNSSALDNLVVMARSSPLDKLKLVKALKERRGDVVAVTGDGTNDAPALKEANIGLSMGIAGTEVAKENSDIIILDDNFTSVVKVVRWGRSVYANIQKFIQFQLTVNVVALSINFVAAVSSGEVPLTAVQLLWVNLIMDTMGALALATEAPTDELMDRKPIGNTEPLITNIMWRNIFGQAIYQIVVLLILTYRGIKLLGLKGTHEEQVLERNTIIFNAFVFCQIFNEINARRPESFNVFQGIHRNYLFVSIIGITVFFQVIIVTFLNKFAETTDLAIKWWGLCVGIGAVALPLAVLIKCVPVPKKPLLEISCFPSKACLRLKRRQRPNHLGTTSDDEFSTSSRISSSRRGMDTAANSRRIVNGAQITSSRGLSSNVITIHT